MAESSVLRPFTSFRMRITALVVVLFAVALGAMGWILVSWVRAALVDELRVRNESLLELASDRIPTSAPDHLLSPESDRLALSDQALEDLEAAAEGSKLELRISGAKGRRLAILGSLGRLPTDESMWLVSTRRFSTTAGDSRLVASASLADVHRSVDLVARSMFFFVPSLVVVAGSLAWVMTGRALSPVQRMTSRLSDIDAATLHRRVPVPQTADEVEALAVNMNELLDRLDRSAQRERQFISDASHELRSPVTAIRAHVEPALRFPERADWPQVAEVVAAQARRLDELVANLFTLARLEEGEDRPLAGKEVDLDELVMDGSGHVPHLVVDTRRVGAARVRGDAGLLSSVVRNLVDNASRYATSRIEVSLTTADGWAVLQVDDDGCGIPPDEREMVFERFARLHPDRARDHGGAGIGLALVRSVARRHGGDATVTESRLGGACFVVTVPLAPTDDEGLPDPSTADPLPSGRIS